MQIITRTPTFQNPVAFAKPPLDVAAAFSGAWAGEGSLSRSLSLGGVPSFYGGGPVVFEDFGVRLTGPAAINLATPIVTASYSACTVFNSDFPSGESSVRLPVSTWDNVGGWSGLMVAPTGNASIGVRTGDTTDETIDTNVRVAGRDIFAALVVSGTSLTLYVGNGGRLQKYLYSSTAPQIAPRGPFRVNGLAQTSDKTFISRAVEVYAGALSEAQVLGRYKSWRLFFLDNLDTLI
ncbi:hypothetical protein [Pseudacidovorax sp. RU35E]|uniref:hypothetical protein n=1 Tax=Pseudacidovorax sp. RU35E TaxID=1907403 RepID=UPI00095683DB|nr:hypothetical protein [Pseudacidovorax sp. RU35E]SIQ99562.1 hypothetical protein SAMN05880557_10769 [Pseudacidovorax sp. RU35E]